MKTYRQQRNIGKARHVISYHDGEKKHADGSPFFDISIFSRMDKAKQFIRELKKEGYTGN